MFFKNECARLILGVNGFTPSEQMFNELNWQRLSDRCNYFTALMVFKCLNGQAPQYLQNKFNLLCNYQDRVTRQSTAGLLALPPRSNGNDINCYKYSFSYNGVKIWNRIESSIRNSPNTQLFKRCYKSCYWG